MHKSTGRRVWQWGSRVLLGVAAVALLGGGGAMAQATPAATPATAEGPAPQCDVAPTSAARLIAALEAATPQPLPVLTPDALPAGAAVEATTARAIRGTVRTAVACRNQGEFARAYALFTDAMIGHLLGRRDTVPPEILQGLNDPQRVRQADRVDLVAIADVTALPDGRAGAVVVTANATHTFTDYLYFADVDGAWLIDEAVTLEIAPVAATPTPED